MRRLSAVFAMLLFVSVVCPAQDGAMSAQQILERVISTYASAESYLAFERRKHDGFETETTTTYIPQVNVEVAQEKLAFNVPEKGK